MGIFADRCQALVDPVTGKALTGKTLEQARLNPNSPRCGNKVKKSARFCNKCGSQAPGGWIRCPSCGKWVGNDSHNCWNCGEPLHPGRRANLDGGVWRKRPEVFAERFEVGDLGKILRNGLRIEPGNAALVIDGGNFKDVLEAGTHDLNSLARKINHWGSPPPRTIVLIDSGEILLPLRKEDLRSAEDLEVCFYGEAILQFDPSDAEAFLTNIFRNREEVSIPEIAERLDREVAHALSAFTNSTTIEDIVKDPDRRAHLEARIEETLERTSRSIGLRVVRISSAEFYGNDYERLRALSGEAEVKRRELEFSEKMRQTATRDRMGKFKTEADLEEYVASIAHEKGISDEKRDLELNRLRQVHRHEIEVEEAAHQMEREQERTRHELGLDRQRHAWESEKKAGEVESEAAETERWVEVRRKKEAAEREHLAALGDLTEGRDTAALIAMIDDPERRKELLQIHRLKELKGCGPEEILALTAADQPEAAAALAKLLSSKADDRDKALEDMKEMTREQSRQLQEILSQAMKTTSEAAKGGGTTINK